MYIYLDPEEEEDVEGGEYTDASCSRMYQRKPKKSEMKEINESTEKWIKAHPFISLCFLLLPQPLVLLFFVTFKPGVKDSREIDYSLLESEVQNPLVQIGCDESITLGKHMS